MATTTSKELLQAKSDFGLVDKHGAMVIVHKGDVVAADDPIVKGRTDLFEPFVPVVKSFKGRV